MTIDGDSRPKAGACMLIGGSDGLRQALREAAEREGLPFRHRASRGLDEHGLSDGVDFLVFAARMGSSPVAYFRAINAFIRHSRRVQRAYFLSSICVTLLRKGGVRAALELRPYDIEKILSEQWLRARAPSITCLRVPAVIDSVSWAPYLVVARGGGSDPVVGPSVGWIWGVSYADIAAWIFLDRASLANGGVAVLEGGRRTCVRTDTLGVLGLREVRAK
jgi:hypothetical protein